MNPDRMLYDEMCRVLTDYEGNGSDEGATADDLYNVLVKIQTQWCNGYVPIEAKMPCVDPRGILSDWLSGTGPYEYKAKEYHYTLIRVRKNSDFDYLYVQQRYRSSGHSYGIERRDKFEYAGIYCRRDGMVYDGSSVLESLFDDPDTRRMHKAESLHNQLEFAVRRTVESAVGNDRNNLRIAELSSKDRLESLARFQEYSADSQAREAYLNSEDDDSIGGFEFVFQCDYSPERWTEDSLLAYILDPNGYVRAEANAYFDSHQEDMLSDFLENDMVAAAYKAIVDNPLNPVHYVKRIIKAVSASSAKTITVTIHKDGKDFTFKTEAREFRLDCTSSYSNWNIVAADRNEFERLFGRSAHYRPEDIVRIEYARSVLYEKEPTGECEEVSS